jgi:hypothetical protein
MRVIQAFDAAVRSVAVSADGRFLAAATAREIGVWAWFDGELTTRVPCEEVPGQFMFTPAGTHLVYSLRGDAVGAPGSDFIYWIEVGARARGRLAQGNMGGLQLTRYSGALAISPDGRTLAATRWDLRKRTKLDLWELPGWRPKIGFDYWSPFDRLRYSPNGEFLAGIEWRAHEYQPASDGKHRRGTDRGSFELRIAVSGGQNGRDWPFDWPSRCFLSFPRHSETVVFGWGREILVMETRAGKILERIRSTGEQFQDVVFIGPANRHLATVDGTSVMSLLSADTWTARASYDWEAGNLTSITATADGLAGVCGTSRGNLVLFDFDE